ENAKEKELIPRANKRRRSKEEIEMDSIQRAGGLRRYADIVRVDEPETPAAKAVPDRVFQPGMAANRRRNKKKEGKKTVVTQPKAIKKVIRIEDGITVSGLSQATGIKTGELIKKLMDLGVMITANQRVETETAMLIAGEYGYTVENVGFNEEDILGAPEAHAASQHLTPRPPVATVMGHVDHGKTSLLDAIRKTNITAKEAGGITQHIGAYQVKHNEHLITFIDTPGHAAFTQMRARGAQVTDIVILVVAADDGVMPQTIEAIDHAKAANVPIIVAINKMDKPDANPKRVMQELTEHSLVPEEWGGDVICVPTSAHTGEGLDKILEMILLQAEVAELKADTGFRAKGFTIEAKLDKGRGPVATVLVQEGTLKTGDFIVSGTFSGKVRVMRDENGKLLKSAGPSTPVEIQGLNGVPDAGDEVFVVESEQKAKLVAETRADKKRKEGLFAGSASTLEDLQRRITMGEAEELAIVIKADVHGSIEAVADSLGKLSTEKVKLRILHKGVGGITESDVMLASASRALVVGFNVQADAKAREAAQKNGVTIKVYRIIYEMIDEVRLAMEGLLEPDRTEKSIGMAEVRQVFQVSKIGQIAGCYVVSGKIQRNAKGRVLRDQTIVYEGNISSLKRFKDDAKEVKENFECGIGIENFNDIKEGDMIEAFIIEETRAKLD
ncbi:MAG: translation initiation factor IF-2, partial [Deltaproteobacteria bacterium CG_4_10_14_0_2_um_filter_43_8]